MEKVFDWKEVVGNGIVLPSKLPGLQLHFFLYFIPHLSSQRAIAGRAPSDQFSYQ